ncbi:hypothetical protein Q8W71_14770 [Methylobacterium sp. NEAU 140]|uniref:hypothetical protein n=1 Tax=Methylobacterium sp. NEAU 140 TaxID=3064945 RepID=UPI002736F360|nr:hypothetical protein [Methylobacterium sp. NEAU 140]MDP4023892.1 hypothetical protein [Methylobacterium sp. NEAU 140]
MSDAQRLLYASANGDRWFLCRGDRPAEVYVLHAPNAPSGGQVSRVDLGHFLAAEPEGPQQQALLGLIGALVERSEVPPASGAVPEPGASAAEPTPGEALG